MNKSYISAVVITSLVYSRVAINRSTTPILYTQKSIKNPIVELETATKIDRSNFRYKGTFYVSIYSDKDNRKVLLSVTLNVRDTTLKKSLYIRAC